MTRTAFLVVGAVLAAALVASVLWWPKERAVTVYCATDDVHAIPILQAFQEETGIPVHWQFDTEASKTVGLVERIRSEKDRPQCDVFWNNEPLHTMRLAEEGLLEAYRSPSAADVPGEFKDPEGRWTGFAGRGRIFIVNTAHAGGDAMPKSMDDLLLPKWKGRAAMAKPVAGTTLTHVVVLYSVLGPEKCEAWLRGLRANEVSFPSGNGPVATSTAEGLVAFGFTDTDDFRKVELGGKPVARVYPDQEPGKLGTLVLPNTVALMRNGPEPELGRKLVDWLLRPEVEAKLANSDGAHIPLREKVARPPHVQGPPQFRAMTVDWKAALRSYDAAVALVHRVIGE